MAEVKKIKTSVSEIMEDIIKFNFSPESRDELQAKITALALYTLSKDESGASIDSIEVNNVAGINCPSATYRKDGCYVSVSGNNLLSSSNYSKDLIAMFHELNHISDYVGKRIGTNTSNMVIKKKEVIDFVTRAVNNKGYYCYMPVEKYVDQEALSDKDVIESYLYAKYAINPMEVDAEIYALKMMERISTYGKDEVKKLKLFNRLILHQIAKDASGQASSDINNWERAHDIVERLEDAIKLVARTARERLTMDVMKGKNYLDIIGSYSYSAFEKEMKNQDVYKDVLYSLYLDYDEAGAETLKESIINMPDSNFAYCSPIIKKLIVFTNYKMSESDIDKYVDRLVDVGGKDYLNEGEVIRDFGEMEIV